MLSELWLVFKDDDNRLFEIVGTAFDDTEFTHTVTTIQQKGLCVTCTTPKVEKTSRGELESEFQRLGFTYKEGLFEEKLRS